MFSQYNTPFVIAEVGVNHNGNLDLALKMLEAAAKTGADAVKFKTWLPGEITGKYAINTSYIERQTTKDLSRYQLSLSNCLTYDEFRVIKEASKKLDILFLSTPDGPASLNFLVDELDMKLIKVGSTELNNLDFLRLVGKKKRPVVLSTGLGTMGEVESAINALRSTGGLDLPLVVLQCTSEYPAPDKEINLKVIETYRSAFGVEVGFSDHSLGIEAAVGAVAFGSIVIEKHFTLSHELEGSDQASSMTPDAFTDFVLSIRRTHSMLGNGVKDRQPSECKNLLSIRRSVVGARQLKEGSKLTKDDLILKRPATGVAPELAHILIGRSLLRDIDEDEPIKWADVS